MRNLKLKDNGDDVSRLQIILNLHRPFGQQLYADGVFGRMTEQAVIDFQKAKGLIPDGVVGDKTRIALGYGSESNTPVTSNIGQAEKMVMPWIPIAEKELGVHRDLAHHHDKRIIEYLKTTTLPENMANTDETAWCSAFVNWVIIQSGRKGTNSAGAVSWVKWKNGIILKTPQVGAIVVIKKKMAIIDKFTGSTTGHHVGFCISYDQGIIRLLGGNQGSKVSYANFSESKWDIKGVIWPSN